MRLCKVVINLVLASVSMAWTCGYGQHEEPIRYVAMGSSFAAGPGITPTAADPGSAACGRSSANYAHLLAAQRKWNLVDVSCGGATTTNLLKGGQFGAARQLDAITPSTRLVTVTIGGNDIFYMATLGGLACQKQPRDPGEKLKQSCAPPSAETVEAAFSGLEQHLKEVAQGVHERSPSARLIFVDYLSVLPAEGSCPNVTLTSSEADRVRLMASRLATIMASAAHDQHADYLPASVLSIGHDACSQNPWTNGFTKPLANGKLDKAPFHPNAEGMVAIERALDAMLSGQPQPI